MWKELKRLWLAGLLAESQRRRSGATSCAFFSCLPFTLKFSLFSVVKPIDHYPDPLQGIVSELISAMSALNMPDDPIPGATGYLSETDAWAKHAMEHLHAVHRQAIEASKQRNAREAIFWRILQGKDCKTDIERELGLSR